MVDSNLIQFNECFPDSRYREIGPYYTGTEHSEYQKSKAPINTKILTFDEIKETKNRIGWIVPKDYIAVDVDNKIEASKLYNVLLHYKTKFVWMVGKHGGHFIFKNTNNYNQGTKFITSIGLTIDIRSMEKGYIILPYNDKDRKWGVISSDVDELPFFLRPLRNLKMSCDFVDMEEGGRNTELLKHFLNLKDYADDLNLDEKVQSIKIINTYIMKEPLSDEELMSTVLRDEMVNRENSNTISVAPSRRSANLEKIASKFCTDYKTITINDTIYIHNGKYYKHTEDKKIERILHEEYDKALIEPDRKEIIKFIKLKTYTNPEDANKRWNEIVLKNGVLNLSDMKLYGHNPSQINTIYIDYNWNESPTYSHIIDSYLNHVTNKNERMKNLLYELIGYCLLQKPIFSKMFILYGGGGTGKSTFLNLLQKLIPSEYTSSLKLHDLENPFMPAELFGKLINVGDDIDAKIVKETGMLKSLVSGEMVTVQRKNKDPFQLRNYAKMIYTCNKLPIVNDKSTGFYRRLCLIEFKNPIKTFDPFFMLKIEDQDMEYLLYKSITALKTALQNNKLSETDDMYRRLESFKKEQSTCLTFLNDLGIDDETLKMASVQSVYDLYVDFCERSRYKPLNKRNFQEELCDTCGYEVIRTTKNGEDLCMRFRKII